MSPSIILEGDVDNKETTMKQQNEMIAACGLDCGECGIFKATNDVERAQRIVDWFKKERDEEVKIEDIYCLSCRGDRTRHWSPDCWILKCCVDQRGLDFCFECEDFPCEKLSEWAQESEDYGRALKQLEELRENRNG